MSFESLRETLLKLFVLGTTLLASLLAKADGPLDMQYYWPEQWIDYDLLYCPACTWHRTIPDSGAYAKVPHFSDFLPGIGYPYHKSLVIGVNDTLRASITFANSHRTKPYVLDGDDVEDWFQPAVYPTFVADSSGPKFKQSSDLGFAIRGWLWNGVHVPAPDTIPERSDTYWVEFSIWNLPQGRFQLCLFPTTQVPGNFVAAAGGTIYDYYPASSLADTINGYEACFIRLNDDGKIAIAELWADSILILHENSVPGNILKADARLAQGDSVQALSYYEKANELLANGLDPLMPDSTTRPLTAPELNYLEWITELLDYHIGSIGP